MERIYYLYGNNQQPCLKGTGYVVLIRYYRHFLCAMIALLFFPVLFSCRRSTETQLVVPPESPILRREYIGFGVINISFSHLLSEYGNNGISQGYIRRGTVVRIIERVRLNKGENSESWVFVESNYSGPGFISKGWIQEPYMDTFENETQAITASKAMVQ
jgi:hypothetical protein